MNSIIKSALKINTLRSLLHPLKSTASAHLGLQQRQFTRNLWYMSKSHGSENVHYTIAKKLNSSEQPCSCGCGKMGVHTKAEKELVEFLTEEIIAERKSQKAKTIPSEIDGFSVNLNGAEVTLTKKLDDEIVKISFNVNHTVDTDVEEPELNQQMDKPDLMELVSKPSFKVDMARDNTTVSLVCSFIGPDQQQDGYNDVFGIDEISIYDGSWNENIYAVSGEVVDSFLYDLLMNYLDEKGVTNEFVEKLSQFSTTYEHSAYIGLLEGLSKFASGK